MPILKYLTPTAFAVFFLIAYISLSYNVVELRKTSPNPVMARYSSQQFANNKEAAAQLEKYLTVSRYHFYTKLFFIVLLPFYIVIFFVYAILALGNKHDRERADQYSRNAAVYLVCFCILLAALILI